MGSLRLVGSESFLEATKIDESPKETAPFIIVTDTREQHPFLFNGLEKKVFTVTHTLQTGDYSICGLERRVCVERKSKQDLFGSAIHGRKRFEREFQRMGKLERSCVVVEAPLEEVRKGLDQSRINPECVILTALAWSGRYRIPWFFCQNRADAEKMTYNFLRFAWQDITQKDTDGGRQNGNLESD